MLKEPACPICESKNCAMDDEYEYTLGFTHTFLCQNCCSTFNYTYDAKYVETEYGYMKVFEQARVTDVEDNSQDPYYHPEPEWTAPEKNGWSASE